MMRRQILMAAVMAIASVTSLAAQTGSPRFQECVSRDGSRVVYVNATDGDPEIYVERVDGTDRHRLTDNEQNDNDPDWSADGTQIAFASDRDGTSQIYLMNADGEDVTRVTDDDTGCRRPRFGPQGQLTYLVHRGRAFKRTLFDLVIRDGEDLEQLQQNIPIWSHAWHPKENLIACATDGRVIVHDLEQRTTRMVTFSEADDRLASCGAFDLAWSPEHHGFVGRLRFLGGVRDGHHVFGDGEAVMISPRGEFQFLQPPRESTD